MPIPLRIPVATFSQYSTYVAQTLGIVCAPNFPFLLDDPCVASSSTLRRRGTAAAVPLPSPQLSIVHGCLLLYYIRRTYQSRGLALSLAPGKTVNEVVT
jgi:hypothetical protein